MNYPRLRWCLHITISVASPICQEGQRERNFPIFAFSSRFFLFFPDFSWFSPDFSWFFPIFGKFSLSGVALCPPCHPNGYATAHNELCQWPPSTISILLPCTCEVIFHWSSNIKYLLTWWIQSRQHILQWSSTFARPWWFLSHATCKAFS